MQSKLLLTGLVVALSLPLGAIAADSSSAGSGTQGGDTAREKQPTEVLSAKDFSTMDTNRDGYISRDEAKSATFVGRYDALDANKDGRLSSQEINASPAAAKK